MYIVDRILDEIMICEDLDTKEFINLPLIENAKEGSYIKIVDNEFIIDEELTKNKKNEIRSKLEYLKKKRDNKL